MAHDWQWLSDLSNDRKIKLSQMHIKVLKRSIDINQKQIKQWKKEIKRLRAKGKK